MNMLLVAIARVLFAGFFKAAVNARMSAHTLDMSMALIELQIARTRLAIAENDIAMSHLEANSLRSAVWGYEDMVSGERNPIQAKGVCPAYDYAREERNHFDAADYRDAAENDYDHEPYPGG